eukprot:scaffold54765_cov31-Tisochrysis_lutea.AAC.3
MPAATPPPVSPPSPRLPRLSSLTPRHIPPVKSPVVFPFYYILLGALPPNVGGEVLLPQGTGFWRDRAKSARGSMAEQEPKITGMSDKDVAEDNVDKAFDFAGGGLDKVCGERRCSSNWSTSHLLRGCPTAFPPAAR